MKKFYTLITCFILSCSLYSQTTFQKIYTSDSDVECFGAYQTTDNGYIFTGIATVNGVQKIFLMRTDCHGAMQWGKTYNGTSSWNNISQRVIETHDHGFLLTASIGSFSAYNILLVRTNASGVTLWKKIMQGNGDDGVNSVIETSAQQYIIAGSTSSYGQDAGSFYKDVYLMKVDDDGNFIWGKTYGTQGTYDEAFDVIETFDQHYAVTGRYIVQGTFQCFLMKTDTAGSVTYMKSFGDTLQETTGYGIANTFDGGYVITGSSTLTKDSYLDYPDEFLIKTDADGDTLWCRSYHGSDIDGSENGSSVVNCPDGSYAIGVATFSYPSVGFVPNKHCVLKTDADGHMQYCRAYNEGGSHYPYLTVSKGGDGYVMSGFSNFYTPNFSATLTKLDSAFESGCNETDETDLTVEEYMPAKIHEPTVLTSSGGSLVNATSEDDFTLTDTTLCFTSLDSCIIFNEVNELLNRNTVQVFPNPSSGAVQISLLSAGSSDLKLELSDLNGNEMMVQTEQLHAGLNVINVNIDNIAVGSYLLHIAGNQYSLVKKIVVAR